MDSSLKKKIIITVAFSICVNLVISFNACWSIFEKALAGSGWTHAAASLPLTVLSLLYRAVVTPVGLMQDRIGPTKTFLIGIVLMQAGLIICGTTMTLPGILIGFSILYATGTASAYSANVSTVMKWTTPKNRGLISGLVISALGLSGVISSNVVGAVMKSHPIAWGFFAGAIYSLPVLLIAMQFVKRPTPEQQAQLTQMTKEQSKDKAPAPELTLTLKQTVRTRRFYQLVLINLFATAAIQLASSHAADIVLVQGNIEEGARFVSLYALFSFFGRLLSGVLSDHFPRKYVFAFIMTLEAVILFLFRTFSTALTLGIGIAVVSFASGTLMSMVPVFITDFFGSKHYGQNYGIVYSASILSGFVPVLIGTIVDRTGSYNGAYLFCGVCSIISIALILTLPSVKKILEKESAAQNG